MDELTGKDIKSTFESLISEKTLVKLDLVGSKFERLTVITGFRRKFSKSFLILGYPEGFRDAVGGADNWEVTIEFTGPENIQYSFTTKGSEFRRDEVIIELPKRINRNQRRKYFRLETPDGTVMEFSFRQVQCREEVFDVSIGGALIALVCFETSSAEDLPFNLGDILSDIELSFPSEKGERTIKIKKAAIVRFENGMPNIKTCCGLEFIEIEESEVKALTEFIYDHQRKFLRNRLRPDL